MKLIQKSLFTLTLVYGNLATASTPIAKFDAGSKQEIADLKLSSTKEVYFEVESSYTITQAGAAALSNQYNVIISMNSEGNRGTAFGTWGEVFSFLSRDEISSASVSRHVPNQLNTSPGAADMRLEYFGFANRTRASIIKVREANHSRGLHEFTRTEPSKLNDFQVVYGRYGIIETLYPIVEVNWGQVCAGTSSIKMENRVMEIQVQLPDGEIGYHYARVSWIYNGKLRDMRNLALLPYNGQMCIARQTFSARELGLGGINGPDRP